MSVSRARAWAVRSAYMAPGSILTLSGWQPDLFDAVAITPGQLYLVSRGADLASDRRQRFLASRIQLRFTNYHGKFGLTKGPRVLAIGSGR